MAHSFEKPPGSTALMLRLEQVAEGCYRSLDFLQCPWSFFPIVDVILKLTSQRMHIKERPSIWLGARRFPPLPGATEFLAAVRLTGSRLERRPLRVYLRYMKWLLGTSTDQATKTSAGERAGLGCRTRYLGVSQGKATATAST